MKRESWAAVVAIAAGCASPPAPAPQGEIDATRRAWIQCVSDAARRLDDLRSDASTIAAAAASQCRPEASAQIEAFSRGMNPDARRMFRDKVNGGELARATAIVLEERRSRAP